jgi:hypothetical protein
MSAVDLLRKSQLDFGRFDEEVNSHNVFNFLCTLNHIPDWVIKDETLPKDAREEAEKLKKEHDVNLIRQLCNRAKHFRKKASDPTTRVQSGFGHGRFGKGPFGVGEPSHEVKDGGTYVNVLHIGRRALTAWEQFFTRHGLI